MVKPLVQQAQEFCALNPLVAEDYPELEPMVLFAIASYQITSVASLSVQA